jgi:hypothetical protein
VRVIENRRLSAAVAAIKEKGVLSGQRIERREIGAPGEFDALKQCARCRISKPS